MQFDPIGSMDSEASVRLGQWALTSALQMFTGFPGGNACRNIACLLCAKREKQMAHETKRVLCFLEAADHLLRDGKVPPGTRN